jgi:3-oxoacyl-[acyl-carrier protein] reductase
MATSANPGSATPAPLAGAVALVTGAGRGIGLAIARRLSADGASVCLTDIDTEQAEEAAGALSATGRRCLGLGGDVSRQEDCRAWAAEAAEQLGGLHLLVNNAGVTRDGMVHRMPDADWDLVQDVVLRGAFNCVRAVAPWFRDRERSAPRRIVNIASVAGIYGVAGNANYVAAKAGLIGLTRALAREWAPFGVTSNAVAPGFIETRLTAPRTSASAPDGRGIPAGVRDSIIAGIPAGRPGVPDDVANAVAFFCTPAAGYVTGQVLEVHGGAPDFAVVG